MVVINQIMLCAHGFFASAASQLFYSGFMLFAGLFYARVMRIPLCKFIFHDMFYMHTSLMII